MFRLTSRTTEENESTTDETRCVRMVFNEMPEASSIPTSAGSLVICVTRAQAAKYQIGAQYPDPVIPAN